ncbi:S1 RNA-binding domain-containing protein 1 [Dicentrarchus labrax]|uniref:S1 RNA-binding domain-containing protein 1 n=1 Tax=Dicentrarchus labrax TaxID=13489 RepID=UPI0021F57CAB|nr:S1 RNA-binding domain-containing protein 1 [Dicentrarchus labrax]XP_051232150.1 S1 RNA-binding domain-containing protein 1 [Dicentrarchus labrax]
MMRRPRATTAKDVNYRYTDTDLSFSQMESSDDDNEEWSPAQPKPKASKTARDPAAGEKKAPAKRTAKPKEPKAPKQPKAPKVPKEPKPRAPRKPAAQRKTLAAKVLKDSSSSGLAGTKRKMKAEGKNEDKVEKQTDCPEQQGAEESGPGVRMKEERVSFIVSEAHQADGWAGEGSSLAGFRAKKEEVEEEDFTFDEPCPKKQKTSGACLGQPSALPSSQAQDLRNELDMNWDLIELLSILTCVERWVCVNIISLLREENTVPFMVRYRKEMINHMDADAVRDVQLVYEELRSLAKKTQSVIQTLRKDGVLTAELEQNLRSCRSADELDHVYSPYKKGSKLTKARRAKALGLEVAASTLLDTPHTLDLRAWVKPGTEGLSSVEEVATGVEHILADMIAKDPETLTYVKTLCENSFVTIQSSVSKSALKEREQEKSLQGNKKPGPQQNKNKDIDKFHLYFDFTCNIQRIQSHQTLAINRGESLKILTVKVNIPDRVKSDFTRWCINNRWRPRTLAREELCAIIRNAVEDSYKRLILPFLTRSYRTKLTSAAEKESIAMFVRNLRQRLLVCPVRGCVIMGVDPGFRHGCKVAILSPTSQILHTDVVYLHSSGQQREADKLCNLMIKYSCTRVVIGNGTACRETESFFTDLISRRYCHPLDVSYCITNEAGASIYSVSPEAVKEMPDLDPNLRSAVSIGRRVQDPMAELVKIDPKHIGIGTYQHDVSAGSLKAALDGVVQECVSFVGVDINICSETLMRHVAGLNAGRAKNIAEWRELNGPFINREQLKLVKGMGPKTYQQCAGFIRINPQTSVKPSPHPVSVVPEKPAAKKGKGKTGVNIPTSFNPLDQTCIHPESYHVAQRFLSIVGGSADQIGSAGLRQCVESKVRTSSIEELAKTVDTTPETLKLIIDGLTQPPGFDIRQNFGQADFKRGIVSMSDLRVGAVLTGRVDNTALFGAFVDIGVGRSGLIHKSNITLDKLPVSQRRRSLALGPGERVEVRVLNVDPQRGRIGLDLIRVLQ